MHRIRNRMLLSVAKLNAIRENYEGAFSEKHLWPDEFFSPIPGAPIVIALLT